MRFLVHLCPSAPSTDKILPKVFYRIPVSIPTYFTMKNEASISHSFLNKLIHNLYCLIYTPYDARNCFKIQRAAVPRSPRSVPRIQQSKTENSDRARSRSEYSGPRWSQMVRASEERISPQSWARAIFCRPALLCGHRAVGSSARAKV